MYRTCLSGISRAFTVFFALARSRAARLASWSLASNSASSLTSVSFSVESFLRSTFFYVDSGQARTCLLSILFKSYPICLMSHKGWMCAARTHRSADKFACAHLANDALTFKNPPWTQVFKQPDWSQCCGSGSGIRCFFTPLDPGWIFSGSRI
jgi:hypothetical protein